MEKQQQQQQQQQQQHKIDKYTIIKTLGKGSFGKVKLCVDQQTGQYFAIKILQNPYINKNFQELRDKNYQKLQRDFKEEFNTFQNLNHPNILRQIEFIEEAVYTKKNGQQYNCMIIVQEYLGEHNLFDYIIKKGKFPSNIAKSYFLQLLAGLKYLHQNQLCHRDLKPENLMVDENLVLKIIDFGFATNIKGINNDNILYSLLGSGVYRSPEIVEDQEYNGVDADLYASAVILFAMLTKAFPFSSASNNDEYFQLIINQNFEEFWNAHLANNQELQQTFDNSLKDLFQKMLAYQPNQRLSIDQIINSEWVQNGLLPPQEQQQLNQQFLQLQQNNIEEEDDQQQQQQQQQQQSTNDSKMEEEKSDQNLFQGNYKFRSLEEMSEEFNELIEQYENIENERKLRASDKYNNNATNILSKRDPNLLLRIILKNTDEFTSEIELSDNAYEMKCTQFNEKYESQGIFKIQFTQQNQNTVCIEFKFVEGNYMEYLSKVKIVRDILKNYGKK